MKVKDLMKQELKKYDSVMVVDAINNRIYPYGWEVYEVMRYHYRKATFTSLTTGKKSVKNQLVIECKKVSE